MCATEKMTTGVLINSLIISLEFLCVIDVFYVSQSQPDTDLQILLHLGWQISADTIKMKLVQLDYSGRVHEFGQLEKSCGIYSIMPNVECRTKLK